MLPGSVLCASAEKSFLDTAPDSLTTATKKVSMPRPPIHWIRDLQKSTAGEKRAGSAAADIPVVVRPETASKRALPGERPVERGIAAREDTRIHDSTVI